MLIRLEELPVVMGDKSKILTSSLKISPELLHVLLIILLMDKTDPHGGLGAGESILPLSLREVTVLVVSRSEDDIWVKTLRAELDLLH